MKLAREAAAAQKRKQHAFAKIAQVQNINKVSADKMKRVVDYNYKYSIQEISKDG